MTKEAKNTVEENEVKENLDEKLSLRDALEIAVEGTKDGIQGTSSDSGGSERTEAKKEVVGDGVTENSSRSPEMPTGLEAPSEWTKEEKEDFKASSRGSQEAALRIHKSRSSKLEEIKTAKRELETYQKLAQDVEPFIKAMGMKESSPVAIQKALQMWKDFEHAENPYTAAASYLKAKGKEVPKEWFSEIKAEKESIKEEINPLRLQVEQINNRLAQEDVAKHRQFLSSEWQVFELEKNAAGSARYPDLNNTESGLRLAGNIGSLVSGESAVSQQFIATVKERIPNPTMQDLIREAYRFNGGKVDESEAARTQTTQSHLTKSNRAAASKPGRSTATSVSGPVKKFKTYREAAQAAMDELNNG